MRLTSVASVGFAVMTFATSVRAQVHTLTFEDVDGSDNWASLLYLPPVYHGFSILNEERFGPNRFHTPRIIGLQGSVSGHWTVLADDPTTIVHMSRPKPFDLIDFYVGAVDAIDGCTNFQQGDPPAYVVTGFGQGFTKSALVVQQNCGQNIFEHATLNWTNLTSVTWETGRVQLFNRSPWVMDDISYRDTAVAPEPASFLLTASGLGILAMIGYRRRKVA